MTITTKYVQPHLRGTYKDLTPEAQAAVEMEVELEAQRILERMGKRDPEYARKLAAKLYAAVTPMTETTTEVGDEE